MAYDAEVTTIERGDGTWIIRIDETGVGSGDSKTFHTTFGDFDVLQIEGKLISGDGATIQTEFYRFLEKERSDEERLMFMADAAVDQDVWQFLAPLIVRGNKKLRHASKPNSGSNNVVWHEYTIRVR